MSLASEGMEGGRVYRMRTRCANSVGFSVYSDYAFIAAGDVPPSPPSAPSALSTSRSSISVQWNSLAASSSELTITGYVLLMSSGLVSSELEEVYRGANRPNIRSFTVSTLPKSSTPLVAG